MKPIQIVGEMNFKLEMSSECARSKLGFVSILLFLKRNGKKAGTSCHVTLVMISLCSFLVEFLQLQFRHCGMSFFYLRQRSVSLI